MRHYTIIIFLIVFMVCKSFKKNHSSNITAEIIVDNAHHNLPNNIHTLLYDLDKDVNAIEHFTYDIVTPAYHKVKKPNYYSSV